MYAHTLLIAIVLHNSTRTLRMTITNNRNQYPSVRERGGRGGGGQIKVHYKRNRNKSNHNNASKQKIFTPQTAGNTPAATYTTVKDLVIQHIQKRYKGGLDVAKSLQDGTKANLSTVEP